MSIMPELILSLLSFSISMTITPGPNNVMVTTSGVNFGYKKTLPHILGITFGFPVMIVLIGLGLGSVFKSFPVIHHILKYIGAAYLLYLAWKIATFSSFDNNGDRNKPFTFLQAVLFQWVNPKAWIIAVGAIAAFTSVDNNVFFEVLLIAFVFFIVCFPCVSLWAFLGTNIKRLLTTDYYRKVFNISMACLLVLSLLPVFL
jgi:threonine/homoserine/homoserine lactone efflux protein